MRMSEARDHMERMRCPADAQNEGKRSVQPQSAPGTEQQASSDGLGPILSALDLVNRNLSLVIARQDTLIDLMASLNSLAMDERDSLVDDQDVPQVDISGRRIG